MSCSFGNIAAHRQLLADVSHALSPQREYQVACIRAAILGSLGSSAGKHEIPSTEEPQPGSSRLHRLLHPLVALTVAVSQLQPNLSSEFVKVEAILREELADLTTNAGLSAPHHLSSPASSTRGAAASPNSGNADGESERLTKLRMEVDLYSYAGAYINYLRGYLALWDELFGPHYSLLAADGGEGGGALPSLPSAMDVGDEAHERRGVYRSHQVPPHLFAVSWTNLLSRERRDWSRGLHLLCRQILYHVAAHTLPMEAYALFILYATLYFRIALLETVGELVIWSSTHLDVSYCTQQLYLSFSMQNELASLQDLWSSFSLMDASFVSECIAFHLACHEVEGLQLVLPGSHTTNNNSATSLPPKRSSALGGGGVSWLPPRSSAPLLTVFCPIFHTRCRMMWLTQRIFWGLHCRCSLLFSSCFRIQQSVQSCWNNLAKESLPGPSRSVETLLRQDHSAASLTRGDASTAGASYADVSQLEGSPLWNAASGKEAEELTADHVRRWQSVLRCIRIKKEFTRNQSTLRLKTMQSASPSASPSPDLHRSPIMGSAGEERSFSSIPSTGGWRDPASIHELQLLRRCGSYTLASAMESAICGLRYPGVLLLISDNAHRPGRCAWKDHRLVLSGITKDKKTQQQGLAPWVLNLMLPQPFVDEPDDHQQRRQLEEKYLRAVVFQVADAEKERTAFVCEDALFFVLNSGPLMDDGRLYFTLMLHPPASSGAVLDRQLQEVRTAAFATLEEVRMGWPMTATCNEAVRIAAAIVATE